MVKVVKPITITDRKALHLKATKTYPDVYDKIRKAGEEWLITPDIAEFHIIDIYEEFVKEVQATVLTET